MCGIAAADRLLGNAEGWATGFDFKTPDRGVATHVYAAFEPSLKGTTVVPFALELTGTEMLTHVVEVNGVYLDDAHIADPWTQTVKPWGTDKVEAERLWKLSEKLVGQEFSY